MIKNFMILFFFFLGKNDDYIQNRPDSETKFKGSNETKITLQDTQSQNKGPKVTKNTIFKLTIKTTLKSNIS